MNRLESYDQTITDLRVCQISIVEVGCTSLKTSFSYFVVCHKNVFQLQKKIINYIKYNTCIYIYIYIYNIFYIYNIYIIYVYIYLYIHLYIYIKFTFTRKVISSLSCHKNETHIKYNHNLQVPVVIIISGGQSFLHFQYISKLHHTLTLIT